VQIFFLAEDLHAFEEKLGCIVVTPNVLWGSFYYVLKFDRTRPNFVNIVLIPLKLISLQGYSLA
jgi:hypothetical protein